MTLMILMTLRRRTLLMAAAIALAAAGSGPAAGDTVTLAGSSIPLRGCRVEAVQSGRVFYRDSRGRRHQRGLDEVEALGFDGLGDLDEAERAIATGDLAGGVGRLLAAMLQAESDLQRAWLHVRLSATHDLLGQYVAAAGHAAAVFEADGDPYWLRLEPLSEPDEPGYAAAREALLALQQARRRVKHAAMTPVIERMLGRVRPIHDRLADRYHGPPIEPGSTISGVPRELIRSGRTAPEASSSTDAPRTLPSRPADENKRTEPTGVPHSAPGAPAAGEAPDSAASIDALLAAGHGAEALAACARVERRVGRRDLGRFLHQYGRALVGVGRPRDAAVMFVRCATLYGDSPHAAPSLIETAIIYRDIFRDPATARRLVERSLNLAARPGRPQVADRARAVLETLTDPAAGDSTK